MSEDDAYYAKILREIEESGLQRRVKLHGRVSEKEKLQLYAHCLGVVYPPVDEDYGYITLEAMLSSKPVLTCTDSGGPLEFIRDGHSGYVTEPDAAALAEAMTRLYTNRARAVAFGRTGREDYLRKEITWETVVEKLLA